MLGIKQEALAYDLGDDWNQKKISLLEQKETIDSDILRQLSAVLKIPIEAFQNFDEQKAITFISSTVNNHDQSAVVQYSPAFNINPTEKWLEALEENKKLYERLLQAEKDKNQLLQKLIDNKL